MRILVLTPGMLTVGGIQRYLAILVRALENQFGKADVRCRSLRPTVMSNGSSSANLSAVTKAGFAARVLRETVAWQPNLIICGHVGLAPLGRLMQSLKGQPYWVVAHGIEVWGRLHKLNYRALVNADLVVAVSEFTRKQVIQLQGVRPERTRVLLPALDEEWLSETAANPSSASDRRPILLTVARLLKLERYKGHDVVMRALPQVRAKFPQLLYVVVGDGDDRSRLEELARNLGLMDSVQFVGSVSGDTLKSYYRDCDVFLMPSETVVDQSAPKGEGFGIAFLEAMACGKPVIGPDFGAPCEFIRHGQHGLLVRPTDPEKIAGALIELLAEPERARQMGAAARELVQSEYSHACFTDRLRQLFLDAS